MAQRISQFARLLTGRHGEDLDAWMSLADADDLLAYSNGPIEGANTKVKLPKRQMYGCAGFALLRHRILLA